MSMALMHVRPESTAISLKSSPVQLGVVIAGVPIRTPPGDSADASPVRSVPVERDGSHSNHLLSTFEHVKPFGRKSHKTK